MNLEERLRTERAERRHAAWFIRLMLSTNIHASITVQNGESQWYYLTKMVRGTGKDFSFKTVETDDIFRNQICEMMGVEKDKSKHTIMYLNARKEFCKRLIEQQVGAINYQQARAIWKIVDVLFTIDGYDDAVEKIQIELRSNSYLTKTVTLTAFCDDFFGEEIDINRPVFSGIESGTLHAEFENFAACMRGDADFAEYFIAEEETTVYRRKTLTLYPPQYKTHFSHFLNSK